MNQILLSICIPTYNRADILRDTLEHLIEVLDPSIEVVISNNCSEDNTSEVIDEFSKKWKNFRSVTQSSTIDLSPNSDIVSRLARGKYIYVLCDDDRLNYDEICKAVDFMEEHPKVLAAFSGYQPWNASENKVLEDFPITEEVIIYPIGSQREVVAEHGGRLWLPLIKREAFERYCHYTRHSFDMISLVGKLLRNGEIALLPGFFYRHAMTEPRMEYNLTEPWYHDRHRSQFEVYIGEMGSGNMDNAVFIASQTVSAFVHTIKFALIKKEYSTIRFYLARIRAYGVQKDDWIMEYEQKYMIPILAEEIKNIVSAVTEINTILIEDIPPLLAFAEVIKDFIPDAKIKIIKLDELKTHESNINEFILTWSFDSIKDFEQQLKNGGSICMSFIDLFEKNRITNWNVSALFSNK